MYRHIMVPVDGSAFSDYALPAATALARRTGALLELVHVRAHPSVDASWVEDTADRLRVVDGIDAFAAHLLDEGSVARTLLEHAKRVHVDFVVMTTHGFGGMHPGAIGTVAQRLVHELEVPILLLRPDRPNPAPPDAPFFHHVLVPLDETARSEEVLEAARQLAYPFGSHVTLLRVVEHGVWPMNVIELQVADAKRKASARAYLERVAEDVALKWVTPDLAVTADESVASAILDSADRVGADVIAMATHGRTGVPRMVLGSTAAEVLNAGRLPLLLFGPAASRHLKDEEAAMRRSLEALSV